MSIADLVTEWGYDPVIVAGIVAAREIEDIPESVRRHAERRVFECRSMPGIEDVKAHTLNAYLETFGVESLELEDEDGDPIRVEYLNTGDPYVSTLLRVGRPNRVRPYLICKMGEWEVGCWGDYAEKYREREGC